MIREEHHRAAVRRYLHRAQHHALARQLAAVHERERVTVQAHPDPVGAR
jgi:hypothetical protein